jgi:hypothetical protein
MSIAGKAISWTVNKTSYVTSGIYLLAKLTYLEIPLLLAVSPIDKALFKRTSDSLTVSRVGNNLGMSMSLGKLFEVRKTPYKEQTVSLLRNLRKDFTEGLNKLAPGNYTTEVNETFYRALSSSKELRDNPNYQVEEVSSYQRRQGIVRLGLIGNNELWKSIASGGFPKLMKEINKKETIHVVKLIKTEHKFEKVRMVETEKTKEKEVFEEKIAKRELKLEALELRNATKEFKLQKTVQRDTSREI